MSNRITLPSILEIANIASAIKTRRGDFWKQPRSEPIIKSKPTVWGVLLAIVVILVFLYIALYTYVTPDIYTFPPTAGARAAGATPRRDPLFIAGSHGNETAPCDALNELVKDLRSRRIQPPVRVTVVPVANPVAKWFGWRSGPLQPDFNRQWHARNPHPYNINEPHPRGPGRRNRTVPADPLAATIVGAGIVVDFHEAVSFNITDSASLGQTVYSSVPGLADQVVALLNTTSAPEIATRPEYRWGVIATLPVRDGTLAEFCDKYKIPYVLVETAGQNDIAPRDYRKRMTRTVCDFFLK